MAAAAPAVRARSNLRRSAREGRGSNDTNSPGPVLFHFSRHYSFLVLVLPNSLYLENIARSGNSSISIFKYFSSL
jgi:hypothetical protein